MAHVLKVWKTGDITLADALNQAPKSWREQIPVALLYTPSLCKLALVSDLGVLGQDGNPISLSSVFEARAFCPAGELRWFHRAEGLGATVFLSEGGDKPADWTDAPAVKALETCDDQYLLWGQGIECGQEGLASGWSWLATARIGKRAVPIAGIGKGDGANLKYQEYLGLAPGKAGESHGNVVVLEERLLELTKFVRTAQKNADRETAA